jgi:hypothetical protein
MWLARAEGEVSVNPTRSADRAGSDLSRAESRLRSLLEETRAYRKYFARADAEALINNARSG